MTQRHSDLRGGISERKVVRKPYNVECQTDDLSWEAYEWLEEGTSDLAWIQHNWRHWLSPAVYEELDAADSAKFRVFRARGIDFEFPMRKRSIDVVRFASKRDALYFQLVFT